MLVNELLNNNYCENRIGDAWIDAWMKKRYCCSECGFSHLSGKTKLVFSHLSGKTK